MILYIRTVTNLNSTEIIADNEKKVLTRNGEVQNVDVDDFVDRVTNVVWNWPSHLEEEKENISYPRSERFGTGYDNTINLLNPILNEHKEIMDATIVSSDPNILKNNLGMSNLNEFRDIASRAENIPYYSIDNFKREYKNDSLEYSNSTLNIMNLISDVASLNRNIGINKPRELKVEKQQENYFTRRL
ncbi:MAG: hypothetical protein E7184_03220 [Erysipelotrichaceae bacterium]|nr:hypothetical protein [Erysipelotrichaceae bacterium]